MANRQPDIRYTPVIDVGGTKTTTTTSAPHEPMCGVEERERKETSGKAVEAYENLLRVMMALGFLTQLLCGRFFFGIFISFLNLTLALSHSHTHTQPYSRIASTALTQHSVSLQWLPKVSTFRMRYGMALDLSQALRSIGNGSMDLICSCC
jgi:hypothetical protein